MNGILGTARLPPEDWPEVRRRARWGGGGGGGGRRAAGACRECRGMMLGERKSRDGWHHGVAFVWASGTQTLWEPACFRLASG